MMKGASLPAIVFLGAVRYDGIYESTSFNTAKSLAQYTTVYYIENPYTIKDLWKERKQMHLRRRWRLFFKRRSILDSGIKNLLIIVIPPLLSIHFLPEGKLYRFFLRVNQRRIAGHIRKLLQEEGQSNYVFINSFNFHYPDVGLFLSPILRIYQCVDALVTRYDTKHGVVSEDKVVKQSDLVVCTSRELCRLKGEFNPNVYFMPNAAQVEHSMKSLEPDLNVLNVVRELKKPIIGYIGNIERRLDYDLLEKLIGRNRQYDFVFAGPIAWEVVPDWIFRQPNLHLIGRIDYESLPQLLKGFAVCLIPFKKNDVSATVFPLKLFEYLGAGKPVIATKFNPDLKEYTKDVVVYVDTAEEFSMAIERSLQQNRVADVERRVAIAKYNTWDERAKAWADLITEKLG
ncbi:glycosyltransferase [Olivibacter sitiensis]|uniref:glycosyltransferase n=1 Tax=Olivibacter sitiensis TaxID=376470 RepID=UPI0004816D5E|nr:glycosyltransferase [Olivibacter sitiensis]